MFKKIFLVTFLALILSLLVVGVSSATKDDVKLRVFVHYPGPQGKPATPSGCSVTSHDQVPDYGLAGWQMPIAGLNYRINYASRPKNVSESTLRSAVAAAFGTWQSTDPGQIFSDAGATSAKTAKLDGVNAVLFKAVRSSAIAITYVWYYTSSGQLAEVDTVFNKLYSWSQTDYNGTNDCAGQAGTYDLQNIATHEFGHWVGLDDLYDDPDKDLTMYGYGQTRELKKDSLGLGDINGVNAIAP